MELQCWRESLNQSLEATSSKAYRWWFFLYNLVQEYLSDDECDEDSSLVDFKEAEKRFASDEIMEEKPKTGRVTLQSLESVLKQFIESSNYAEFSVRMDLLRSFKIYVQRSEKTIKRRQLVNLIHNIHLYFTQFSARIQEQIDFVRKPVEKKLKDFVKIESFNKDLSYFSMRTNIQRTHRGLHKILKEFELEVSKKILDLLIYRDSNTEFHDFKNQNAWKIITMKSENFITDEIPTSDTINELQKYTIKSRKIVEKALDNAKYSQFLEDFIDVMDTQLETCLHLRTLEVDRDQPRNKQKSQAKQILNQKRKALTDFFKLMSRVGVSYKTGILTSQLKPELVDLQLEPFNYSPFQLSESLNAALKNANHRLDHYFNKVILKMKQLSNALLMPRPDMDYAFIERMKGFSIDLFDIVQQQRENLSSNWNDLHKLNRSIAEMNVIVERSNDSVNYEVEGKQLELIKSALSDGITILAQFEILMKCAPSDVQSNQRVLVSSNNIFTHKSSLHSQIVSSASEILREMKSNMKNICTIKTKFVGNLTAARTSLENTCMKLKNLKELFVVDNEYSIYGQSIVELHQSISCILSEISNLNTVSDIHPVDLNQNIEKVSHSILIAIQNIYKKFEDSQSAASTDENESFELEEYHLKDKIHQQLVDDFKQLNVSKINTQLDTILQIIFTSSSSLSTQVISSLYPLVKQYELLCTYFLIQQSNSNRSTSKMLSIMLSVFLELSTKGFCVPQDLLSDEEQKEEKDSKTGEGFGFEDGTGDNDVSDKLESEDQLDEAKRPEDIKNNAENEQQDCKEEEKGIDMSQDFEGKMQDVEQNNDDSDNEKEEDEEELDKEMGETGEGADKLDDQIWGSDAEEDENESKENKDEDGGKGASEKDDKHDDLGNEEGQADGQENEDALDATAGNENQQKPQKKDIDKIDEQGEEEEQMNPYHNELEEPPQPEDIDIEEMDLDHDNREDAENPEENPFDIDTMKEQMESSEDAGKDEEGVDDDKDDNVESGSDNDDDEQQQDKVEHDTIDPDQNDDTETPEEIPNENNEEQKQPQMEDEVDHDEEKADKNQKESKEKSNESKDKNKSKEENVQALPDQNPKSSHDNTEVEVSDNTAKQENEVDEQDTGEDREGIGQAENQESKSGHQGIADTKEMKSKPRSREEKQQQKRKTGNTDEDRTLGDVDRLEKKHLKTVDQMDRSEKNDDNSGDEEMDEDADEFQHVKDAKSSGKTTMDNATEEQSKKLHHDENSKNQNEDENLESNDQLMEKQQEDDVEMLDKKELESLKNDKKSEKPSKSNERSKEIVEQTEEVEIEGETVTTFNVPRGDETTAHCQMDIVNDASMADEPTTAELLELRKQVESEMSSTRMINPDSADMEQWQDMSNRMANNARDLCEQLRLILEPTKCTRLKGDYRTGRRINMKKIIPYIASQFRKDKIWLRRTKAAQRDYKITIAVDDSKSMDHNNSKNLTMQAISLVAQALTLLESGKLCVMSFGETPKILLKYNEQFNGPKIVSSLNFEQNQSKIAELLDFSRTMNQEDASGDNGIFEHLLIVLSDGRNIFSEGETKVKNAVKLARLQRMFIVYIIIDNPDNKVSLIIYSIQIHATINTHFLI